MLQCGKITLLLVFLGGSTWAGTAERKTFQSAALGKQVTYWLYRPSNYEAEVAAGKKFSVIYLMHWWLYKAEGWHVQDQYRRNPKLDQCIDSVSGIICVSPQDETTGPAGTGTSWWVDSPRNPAWKYSTLIAKDLVEEVEKTNTTNPNRAHRGVCGASMGGFGALHNLRVRSDVFSVGFAIVPLTNLSKHLSGNLCNYGTCLPMTYDASLDPMQNVANFKFKDIKLGFYTGHCRMNAPACANTPFPNTCAELNCHAGTDFFEQECVEFSTKLTDAGVEHTFYNFEGDGHEYPDPAKMVMILKFFERNFGTTSVSAQRPVARVPSVAASQPVRLVRCLAGKEMSGKGYVGIDGRQLKSVPSTGVVIQVKKGR